MTINGSADHYSSQLTNTVLSMAYSLAWVLSLICSDTDWQTMIWAIFHFLSIKLKFQWVILFKFNIAISVVNGPFFCWPVNKTMVHGLTPSQSLHLPKRIKSAQFYYYYFFVEQQQESFTYFSKIIHSSQRFFSSIFFSKQLNHKKHLADGILSSLYQKPIKQVSWSLSNIAYI